jgi:hypothetical protein
MGEADVVGAIVGALMGTASLSFIVLKIRRGLKSDPLELPGGGSERDDEVADVSVHIRLVMAIGRRHTELRAHRLVPPGLHFSMRFGRGVATLVELPEHVRELLGGRFAHARLRAERGLVTLTHAGTFASQEELDAAVVIVAELARVGVAAVHALRELPGAVYEAPRGAWDARTPPRVTLPAHGVTFEIVARDGAAVTIATTELPRAAALAPRDDAARAVGAASLRADDGVLTLAWPAIELDGARLLAGAELVRATAASLRQERYG